MCNLYDIGPATERLEASLKSSLAGVIAAAEKRFGIRKTDPAVVAISDQDEIKPATMRWGFHRPFNPAINNARSDKLNSRMWDDAWTAKQRCVIPVATFYEWSDPTGSKQTHAFQPTESGSGFFMAGLWEKNTDPEIGDRFTMLTTAASKQVERIHNRMPAILKEKDFDEFLHAENPLHLIQPFAGELKIFDCENPLKMKPADHQGPIPIAMLPGF